MFLGAQASGSNEAIGSKGYPSEHKVGIQTCFPPSHGSTDTVVWLPLGIQARMAYSPIELGIRFFGGGDVVRCEIANSILMRVRKRRKTVFPESALTSFGEQRRSTLPVRESSDNDVPRKPVNNIRGTTSFNNDVFERKLAEALGPMEVKTLLRNTENPMCIVRRL